MNLTQTDWLTLSEVANMLSPPLTVEAVRVRLKKPNAPQHQKYLGRWLINKQSLTACGWLDN